MRNFIGSWLRTIRIIGRNLRQRKYEPEIPFLAAFLSPGEVCLHIGASDGRHTIVMSRLVGPGHVHCFEPSSFTLTVLERALRFHRIKNVTTHNFAMGEEPGTMNLVTPVKRNGHLGRSFAFLTSGVPDRDFLYQSRQFPDRLVEPVKVDTVDRFCASAGLSSVQFIRCDVEGAEILILRGAKHVLDRDRPVLLLEVHPHSLRDHFDSSAEEVRAFLAARGYRFYYADHNHLTETETFFDEPWRDYFCVPEGKGCELNAVVGPCTRS